MLIRLSPASALALFLTFAGSQQAFPQTPQINPQQEPQGTLEAQEQAKQPQNRSGDILPLAPHFIPRDLSDQGNQKTEGSDYEGTEYWPVFWGLRLKITDSLLALFTLLLVIATGILGWSTVALWRVTRDEFIATHRPRLRVRGILFDGFTKAEILPAWVYVANVGANDATNIRFDAVFTQKVAPGVRKPPWIEKLSPDNTHGKSKLIGGEKGTYEPSPAADFLPFEADEINKHARTLMLIGRIRYTDRIGTERETGFGWNYDASVSEFRKPDKEDEYNYED